MIETLPRPRQVEDERFRLDLRARFMGQFRKIDFTRFLTFCTGSDLVFEHLFVDSEVGVRVEVVILGGHGFAVSVFFYLSLSRVLRRGSVDNSFYFGVFHSENIKKI